MTENAKSRGIGQQARRDILWSVWRGEKNVAEACREAGISRVTYYKWERAAKKAMNKALSDSKPGRKEKDWRREEDLRGLVKELRQTVQEKNREIVDLHRAKQVTEMELYLAGQTIRKRIEEGTLDLKKNPVLARRVKKLLSRLPTEPPKMDGLGGDSHG